MKPNINQPNSFSAAPKLNSQFSNLKPKPKTTNRNKDNRLSTPQPNKSHQQSNPCKKYNNPPQPITQSPSATQPNATNPPHQDSESLHPRTIHPKNPSPQHQPSDDRQARNTCRRATSAKSKADAKHITRCSSQR